MTEIQSYAIKNIRVVSTFMIFLCHTVFLFGETVGLTAQFFNIAVTIFFFISAYLYSLRENVSAGGVLQWYKKRFLRIAIPYYIYLAVLFILYIVTKSVIKPTPWITSGFMISGLTETYLSQTGHLWFVTAILLCYAITPLLYRVRQNKSFMFIVIAMIAYIPLAIFLKPIISTYYSALLEYILAFFLLDRIISSFNKKRMLIIGFVLFILGCIIKLFGVRFFDDTVFYTKFISGGCSIIIGFAIFVIIYTLSHIYYKFDKWLFRIIDFFDSISYEFYIVHMIFIKGNFSVLKLSNPFLNICLAFVLSLIFGYLLHILSNQIFKVIKWRKKH